MNNEYGLSADTLDAGGADYEYFVVTRPQGAPGIRSSKFGYVGIVAKFGSDLADRRVCDGMNTAGLTCDAHTLLGTKLPSLNRTLDNMDAGYICTWALEGYSSVAGVAEALGSVNFVESTDPVFQAQQ